MFVFDFQHFALTKWRQSFFLVKCVYARSDEICTQWLKKPTLCSCSLIVCADEQVDCSAAIICPSHASLTFSPASCVCIPNTRRQSETQNESAFNARKCICTHVRILSKRAFNFLLDSSLILFSLTLSKLHTQHSA